MVELFDTAEMDRWTPLPHPFDAMAATAYVLQTRDAEQSGTVQRAITTDGGRPLGEVLLFPTDEDGTCELGYAVGGQHQGAGLASRSVVAMLPVARAAGFRTARLRIDVTNERSARVAATAGFTRTDQLLVRRERKGYTLDLATWTRALG